MYAIIEACGKQYKVAEGDEVFVEKLNLEAGSEVVFEEVLLIGNKGKVKVGTPTVKGAKVVAKVVKEGKQKKVLVFRYKNKTNHDILRGHRQPYTLVEITSIEG